MCLSENVLIHIVTLCSIFHWPKIDVWNVHFLRASLFNSGWLHRVLLCSEQSKHHRVSLCSEADFTESHWTAGMSSHLCWCFCFSCMCAGITGIWSIFIYRAKKGCLWRQKRCQGKFARAVYLFNPWALINHRWELRLCRVCLKIVPFHRQARKEGAWVKSGFLHMIEMKINTDWKGWFWGALCPQLLYQFIGRGCFFHILQKHIAEMRGWTQMRVGPKVEG